MTSAQLCSQSPPAAAGVAEAIVARVVELFTLPRTAIRIMAVARDPSAGAIELKRAVEGDPTLAARVLRAINSSHAGLRARVTNLQQAISLLGFSQVRNLALTAAIGRLLASERRFAGYSRVALWRHLVAVAVASRFIALRCGIAAFEDAFLAGLLHDLGIAVLDQQAHGRFAQALLELRDGEELAAAEQRVLGCDHCQVGAALARAWGFADVIGLAIEHHHDSAACPAGAREIVSCVEAANALCTLKGFSSIGRNALRPPIAALEALGLGRDDVLVLARDLDDELACNQRLLEL